MRHELSCDENWVHLFWVPILKCFFRLDKVRVTCCECALLSKWIQLNVIYAMIEARVTRLCERKCLSVYVSVCMCPGMECVHTEKSWLGPFARFAFWTCAPGFRHWRTSNLAKERKSIFRFSSCSIVDLLYWVSEEVRNMITVVVNVETKCHSM